MVNVFRTLLSLALAGGLATTATSANAAESPSCMRELAHVETSLLKTLVRVRGLTQAKGDERCAVYHDHVAVVAKARDVFARCKTGAERDTEVHQLDGALTDANAVIAKTCTN